MDSEITNPKKFLTEVYKYKSNKETQDLYEKWYMSYDDELKSNNYSTPKRCAKALKKYLTDSNSHILDIGCGTGLSGQEILNVGFKNVDGTDFSDKMLFEAKNKNIYKGLFNLDLNSNFYNLNFNYNAIVAAGIISPHHANPSCLEKCLNILSDSGLLIFSLNDHAVENKNFMDEIFMIVDKNFEILEKTYGDHLPGIKLNSFVYVIKKLKIKKY